MSADGTGPNLGNLRGLRDILPTMAHGVASHRIGGRGRSVKYPDKTCRVCGLCWGSAPAESDMKHTFCEGCVAKINDGYTAIVSGNRYAFVVMPKQMMPDGKKEAKILQVAPVVFDKLVKLQESRSHGFGNNNPPKAG